MYSGKDLDSLVTTASVYTNSSTGAVSSAIVTKLGYVWPLECSETCGDGHAHGRLRMFSASRARKYTASVHTVVKYHIVVHRKSWFWLLERRSPALQAECILVWPQA